MFSFKLFLLFGMMIHQCYPPTLWGDIYRRCLGYAADLWAY